MIWSATITGQPPSLNDLYRPVIRYGKGGRQYHGIGKDPKAQTYQDGAARLLSEARPSGWHPTEQVRVFVDLYLGHDIDADNCLKVLMDALEDATGVNDKLFLPCIRTKHIGIEPHRIRVELWIEDIES